MCKQIVNIHGERPRNCKLKDFADGWCKLHHPDTVEERLINELIREDRIKRRAEATSVGLFVMHHYPDQFSRVLTEIDEKKKARNGGK